MRQHDTFQHEPIHQLALEIDGVALTGALSPEAAYRVALATLDASESGVLARLAENGPITAIGGLFDDIGALLRALGCTVTSSELRLPPAPARVVAVGCPHRSFDIDPAWLAGFLDAGGLLITSDKAAHLPALADLLPTRKPQPPRRARLMLGGRPDDLLPAVALDAGHAPLDPARLNAAADVLAYDALTGDPLVVSVRAGAGHILHAVPHWRQTSSLGFSALEARPLRSVAAYRERVPDAPDGLSLGAFRAAEAMLRALAAGLRSVHGDWRVPPAASGVTDGVAPTT
jgi:hypothetical protein